MFTRYSWLGSVLTGFAAALVFAACGGGGSEVVTPIASSFDLTTSALTGFGGATITPVGIVGSYGPSCKVHGGETWDLRLNDPLDRSLEVALNDSFANCPLTMQRIDVEAGSLPLSFSVIPPVLLGLDYQEGPSAVNQVNPLALAFYTNAKLGELEGPLYTNDFAINVVYSDDALSCGNFAPPAIYATVNAVANGAAIAPPSYVVGYEGLKLLVDANQVVQPVSAGAVVLAPKDQVGEEWKLFDETTSCCRSYSFLEIDSIYKTFTPVASGAIAGAETVPFSPAALNLIGQKLPEVRTLIFKHTGEGGVYSYELIQIAFPPAH